MYTYGKLNLKKKLFILEWPANISSPPSRSGRKNERGKVILQTFDPYHWVIKRVMEYDFKSLYKQ